MTSSLYALLSNSASGLIFAALVALSGFGLVRLARTRKRSPLRYLGYGLCGLAAAVTVGSVVCIVRSHNAVAVHPAPGKLIDVGGFRLHILAEGAGRNRPTLIWIPGEHAPGFAFYGHHKLFRAEARSILFDRAGSGWSDTGPFPRRTAREAEELYTLLERAGERGPFILIGHSYGGLLAANYARRHPEKVAGLVLLDALQPDMAAYNRYVDGDGLGTLEKFLWQHAILKLAGIRYDPFASLARDNPDIARALRKQEEYLAGQSAVLDALDDRPATDWATLSLNEELHPGPISRESLSWLVYDHELGNLPVWIVIPRDEVDGLIAQSKDDPARQRRLRLFQQMQKRYLQISSHAALLYAPAGTGHNFPYETPDFVTDVVRTALRETTRAMARPTLFRDVNVITMIEDRVLTHRDVLVSGGKISRVSPTGTLKDAGNTEVIEGANRYLMPGLTEMHAHLPGRNQEQFGEDVLSLFLANGFTTVRSMLGNPWHLELRARSARDDLLAPRLFVAGPSINGQSAPDVPTAVAMIREQSAAGYDFLKLHPGLTRDVFAAIVRTSEEQHITFQGHISEEVGVAHALEAHQRAIDHLDGYLEELAEPACRKRAGSVGFFGLGIVQCVDETRIPELVSRTKQAGTWMVPTQHLIEQWTHAPGEEQLRRWPSLKYMPPDTAQRWMTMYRATTEGQTMQPERLRRLVELRRALLREMLRQKVPIALGSDAPQIFNVPGESALAELELYQQIGFTPYEALKTGTTAPAEFFRATEDFGTVKEGLSADLVLLRRNPLEDVRAVRELDGVMVRGHWLARAKLDEMLAQIAARMKN